MKKIFLSVLTLGLVLTACNKKTIDPVKDTERIVETHEEKIYVDNNDYSKLNVTENGVLEFKTIEYYESLVNSEEDENPKLQFLTKHIKNNLNFNSLKNTIQNREEDLFDDEFMNSILDENLIVKIDKWYIRLNPETEKTYAVSDEHINAYELALREDQSNENTYTFTFDEEVLTYLADEELLQNRKLFCKDRYAYKKEASSLIKVISQVPSSNGVQMHVKVKYHKYGIYFTLKAKGYHQNVYNNYLRYWFQLDNCSYAQRCGSANSNYSHPWITPSTSITNGGQDVLMTYKFYNGVKQLKSYQYKVRIRCESTYGATFSVPYYVTYTDYAVISDF